jgi:hypothetical protein
VTEALPKEDVVDAEYQNGNSQPAQAAPQNNTTSAPESGPKKPESGAQNRPTKDQFSRMGALANKLFASKEERLQSLNAWLANQGYEEVNSASELTKEQAAAFIEELEEMASIKRQEKQEETNHA